ncbi:MAG: Inositol 2-dehydrogenase [Actinomycetota bacterium]|nr:Inositol 2-dehydrogenase [Actinomycetota bacterium]
MTVRVGVIGVGSIGTEHARTLARRTAGSTVTAVYDASHPRALTIAAELGATATESAEALIHDDRVDAVVIASPDDQHAAQALACISAGKPTLCEKPLAPQLDDALAVVAAEVTLGRRLLTLGFMRRFDPGYAELKARLDRGEVGEPLLVHCIHRNPYVGPEHTTALSLTNSAVHEIDVNRWLLGEEYDAVQVVSGRATPHAADGLRDPLLVLLRTARGVLVEVEHFSHARYGYDVRCEVVASEGTLELGDGAFIASAREGRHGRAVADQWLARFADAYRIELQSWVDAVAGGASDGPSAWDGYAATAVAGACVEALATGGWIPVALAERPALYDAPA